MPANPVVFSVDEFAVGIPLAPLPPNVTTKGAAVGASNEACADVYIELGAPCFIPPPLPLPWPPFPPGVGNTIVADGNGAPPPAVLPPAAIGLVEPNPPFPGIPDQGDNLDALDIDTQPHALQGPVYFSLDSAFADPLEAIAGPPPNTGTAAANPPPAPFFVGGDVLVQPFPGPGAPPPFIYAPAQVLGLDPNRQDIHDLDALILLDLSNPEEYEPFQGDFLAFSVRRGSAVIGAIDPLMGIPIEEGNILIPPPPGAGGPPNIFIAAEWLGLATMRSGTGGQFGNDLNALDTVPEPSTVILLGLGTLCLAGYAWKPPKRTA